VGIVVCDSFVWRRRLLKGVGEDVRRKSGTQVECLAGLKTVSRYPMFEIVPNYTRG